MTDSGIRPRAVLAQVARASGIAFALRGFGAALALVFNVLLARRLGPDGLGIFTLAFTCLTFASVLGQRGLNYVAIRFVAARSAEGDQVGANAAVRLVTHWTAVASGAVACALIVAADPISRALFSEPELVQPLRVMALVVVPFSVLSVKGDALKGAEKIGRALLVQAVIGPATSLLVLAVVQDLTTTAATFTYGFGVVVAFVVTQRMWAGVFAEAKPSPHTPADLGSQMRSMAGPLYWVSILELLMATTSTVVLGIWEEPSDVGLYFVALRLTAVSTMLISAFGAAVGPRFAAMWTNGDVIAIRSLVIGTTALMSGIATVVCGGFILLAGPLMGLFGEEFAAGGWVLIILALGQFVSLATGPVGTLVSMTDNERLRRSAVAVATVLNVVLSVLLVNTHGVLGAAWATSASLMLKEGLTFVLAWWRTDLLRPKRDQETN